MANYRAESHKIEIQSHFWISREIDKTKLTIYDFQDLLSPFWGTLLIILSHPMSLFLDARNIINSLSDPTGLQYAWS